MKYYWKTETKIQLKLKKMKKNWNCIEKFAITEIELKLRECNENWNWNWNFKKFL